MRRQVAFLMLGAVLGLVAGIALAPLIPMATRRPTTNTHDALAAMERHLDAGDHESAHDALLFAMRVAPDDERVFDASLAFIRKGSESKSDDAVLLAHDVHERAANMIPFVPLERLERARQAHTKAGEKLFAGKESLAPEDSLDRSETMTESSQFGTRAAAR